MFQKPVIKNFNDVQKCPPITIRQKESNHNHLILFRMSVTASNFSVYSNSQKVLNPSPILLLLELFFQYF